MPNVVDIHQVETETYMWGQGCQAWVLNNSKNVTIKEELMAPSTREQLHLHKTMEQFFYILEGSAVMTLENRPVQINPGQGLHIPVNTPHFIANKSSEPLRFLVISTPGESVQQEKRTLLNN